VVRALGATEAERRREPEAKAGGPASSTRAAFLVFAAIELVAAPLMLRWDHGTWFQLDDWDFVAARTGGNLGDLFRPHYEHWTTLPVVAYRLMWQPFGLHSAAPYQLLVILGHLTVAALLRAVMRRAGVGPWISTAAATLFVFLGAGAENILVAFQITFVWALALGLAHLLLADHDGPIDRRDWLGLVAGVVALMCSGVAVSMAIVVGLATLLRRGWRVALLHTAPLGAVYLLWRSAAPKENSPAYYHANSPGEMIRFIAVGFRAVFRGLGQLPGVGVALGVLLILGLALCVGENRRVLRGNAAATVALLGGAVVFLAIAALYRSGAENGLAVLYKGYGAEHARTPRYVHIVAAMVLPALALAAETLIRHWRRAATVVVVLLLVGLPGNIDKLASYADLNRSAFVRSRRPFILTAPRLPLARQLPRSVALAPQLSLGWLIDSLPSGRIPEPARRPPSAIADETLALALAASSPPQTRPCKTLVRPVVRTMQKGDRLTLQDANAVVTYLPNGSAPSAPKRLTPSTFVALAGPLQLRFAQADSNADHPATLCG
jgi:hypothetical protein